MIPKASRNQFQLGFEIFLNTGSYGTEAISKLMKYRLGLKTATLNAFKPNNARNLH